LIGKMTTDRLGRDLGGGVSHQLPASPSRLRKGMTMTITRRDFLGTAAAAVPLARAGAQSPSTRIGVMSDESGVCEGAAMAAVKLAIDDTRADRRDIPIQIISGDCRNMADVGASLARQWIEREGVDIIIGPRSTAASLAVARVCNELDKIYMNSPGVASDLIGPESTSTTIHWTMDALMLAHWTGRAMVEAGNDRWHFVSAEYAFGHALRSRISDSVIQAGGKVLGNALTPLGNGDFSPFFLQARSGSANVIGLCNVGADTVNAIRHAGTLGITAGGVKLAAPLMFIGDVHALGLQAAQGIVVSEPFYWDRDEGTRRFSRRLQPTVGNARPDVGLAGCYAGTFHYLKAVTEMGTAEAKRSGAATVARMKAIPTNDDCFGQGRISVDGRCLHSVCLYEVKSPAESKYPWDYYKPLATTSV
jgi:branched-chain amino acid transport system substrate-binding protein